MIFFSEKSIFYFTFSQYFLKCVTDLHMRLYLLKKKRNIGEKELSNDGTTPQLCSFLSRKKLYRL